MPILDVTPFTGRLLSTMTDPQMAENSTSFSEDVGEVRRHAETQVMPRGGAWPNA